MNLKVCNYNNKNLKTKVAIAITLAFKGHTALRRLDFAQLTYIQTHTHKYIHIICIYRHLQSESVHEHTND